ncbi:MAG TPA: DNA polymerase III subunit alpha [Dehalococcoidia bacterium]|nr:DNA polymerase III subunit alpha [Chloroflexota bacterium]MDP5877678.1 DNA polymerase III subunit alpha [Dehalococcoidia bacterium]MDP7159641.1 DNA polymerase III subunit alpha [Dehalococcoidia bacterium]MDP7213715.1 DNA polymerase III subunit alpha [Dehalococcoidia bacterium]HCV26843.1 DNA polymerase III subunit alpha [Dehalococcoidia bacterium]
MGTQRFSRALFAHLHNHSEYSLLDGLSSVEAMAARAAELGQSALALTDHGVMYGAIDFYSACKRAGIKPIIGMEGYVAPESRLTRNPSDRSPYHMTVLAKNEVGYGNLLKLASKAQLEGFYYHPRMDRELLEQHSDGLVILSGCLSGEVGSHIVKGQIDKAREAVNWYRGVFGDDYYLEVMWHEKIPEQLTMNRGVFELARDTGTPLVATNDNHYTNPSDHELHDVLLCIQTNSLVTDTKRMKLEDPTYYLRSEAEMAALFPEHPEAIANSGLIAEACDLEIDFTQSRLPRYQTPNGETALEYVRQLCEKGMGQRYPNADQTVIDRLNYELEVIESTGFPDYFLVVWDIANFVHREKIVFGVRGSAAASVVLYCLGVTDIDPLATHLVFERFLNLERREMPDIDMDFQDDRREEVIRYCLDKYGEGHVAQIVTFGTLGAKAAVRDVGRALGTELSEVDRLARLIPNKLKITLEEAIYDTPELRQIANDGGPGQRLLELAQGIEGTVRHASTHAAGVMITEEPLTDFVPLARATNPDANAVPTTQYPMAPLDDLGLLKMDFLGLTNLTILDRALKLIAETCGETMTLPDIPLDDPATFKLLSSGETAGVFQLEGSGMRRYIKELRPNSVMDIAAMIALYRPGPMEFIGDFINAKHGRTAVTYPHDDLRNLLEETYGIVVYQDQVLLIAQRFGGYTLGEADILRKAMGKKDPEVMAAESEKFINGGIANGYSPELSQQMFDLIEPFAGYAFNKAHSVCYAMVSYWTAYLKANYTVEYMVAFLDAATGAPDKLSAAISECRRIGISVLAPDINRAQVRFAVDSNDDGDAIRFGLAAVKNVGMGAVEPIIEKRDSGGRFDSLEDFCKRVDFGSLNKRALESLIKVGGFDNLGDRGAMIEGLDRIMFLIRRETELRDSGQSTMFDMLGDAVDTPLPALELPSGGDVTDHERTLWERELLGVEITENPIMRSMYQLQDESIVFANQLTVDLVNLRKSSVGQVGSVHEGTTRKGDRFLRIQFGLLGGEIELVVWSNVLVITEPLWKQGTFVSLTGTVREREGRVSISVEDAREYRLPGHEEAAHLTNNSPSQSGAETGAGPTAQAAQAVPSQNPNRLRPTAPMGNNTPAANGNGATQESPTPLEPAFSIRVSETGVVSEDKNRFEDVIRLLLNYKGDHPFILQVETGERIVTLEMPFAIQPCDELVTNLSELIGSENILISEMADAAAV